MTTIDIRRAHSLGREEARRRAARLAQDLERSIGIRWGWAGDRIEFETPGGIAQGTAGTLHVYPTEIRVEVSLPFLLSLAKSGIESKINANLDEALG